MNRRIVIHKHWHIRLTNEAKRRNLSISAIICRCIIHQLPQIMAMDAKKKKRPYGLQDRVELNESKSNDAHYELDILWESRLVDEAALWDVPQAYMVRKMIIEKALPVIEKQEVIVNEP